MPIPSYIVRSGDTLGRIAQQHYADSNLAAQLAKHNHIANPNHIVPGQVIELPLKVDLLRGRANTVKIEYSLYARRYAPFRSFGGGFEGDGRGFSTSLTVTSRTVGVATFSPQSGTHVAGTGYSTGSSWVGPWEVRKSLPLGSIGHSVGQVRVTVMNVAASQGKVSFTLYTEGNLPLKDILLYKKLAEAADKVNNALRRNSPRPQGTPDIDTFVDIAATFSSDKVVLEGVVRGDGFPNAEVFVLDANSKAVALLDYRTKSGEAGPLYRLFGTHAANQLVDTKST